MADLKTYIHQFVHLQVSIPVVSKNEFTSLTAEKEIILEAALLIGRQSRG